MRSLLFVVALSMCLFSALARADDSGTWGNNLGTRTVDVSIDGSPVHGDLKVTFTHNGKTKTVTGVQDQSGGSGDISESDEATFEEKEEDGTVKDSITYKFSKGDVWYKLHGQTTWRRMTKQKDSRLGYGYSVGEFEYGDDTVGTLP